MASTFSYYLDLKKKNNKLFLIILGSQWVCTSLPSEMNLVSKHRGWHWGIGSGQNEKASKSTGEEASSFRPEDYINRGRAGTERACWGTWTVLLLQAHEPLLRAVTEMLISWKVSIKLLHTHKEKKLQWFSAFGDFCNISVW